MPLTSRLLLFFLCPAGKKGGVGVPSGLLAGKARGPQAIGPRIRDARLVAPAGFIYACLWVWWGLLVMDIGGGCFEWCERETALHVRKTHDAGTTINSPFLTGGQTGMRDFFLNFFSFFSAGSWWFETQNYTAATPARGVLEARLVRKQPSPIASLVEFLLLIRAKGTAASTKCDRNDDTYDRIL